MSASRARRKPVTCWPCISTCCPKRAGAAKHLVEAIEAKNWHLSTGFVGLSYLLPTLTRTGRLDIAYRLLTNETFPSWGYSIKNGATSIWERWDGWTEDKGFQDPGMNSFNHYAFGSVGRWLFNTVAGIDTDGAGYKQRLAPQQRHLHAEHDHPAEHHRDRLRAVRRSQARNRKRATGRESRGGAFPVHGWERRRLYRWLRELPLRIENALSRSCNGGVARCQCTGRYRFSATAALS
jgi:hypothetical protein